MKAGNTKTSIWFRPISAFAHPFKTIIRLLNHHEIIIHGLPTSLITGFMISENTFQINFHGFHLHASLGYNLSENGPLFGITIP